MSNRPVEPGRTAHPAMTAAVLASLGDRAASARTAERVAELLATGRAAPERLHAVLVGTLWTSAGGPGLQEAADRLLAVFGTPEPAAGPEQLAEAAGRLEAWLHLGHRTLLLAERDGLTIRHVPYLGSAPAGAESLFVRAVQGAAARARVGRRVRVRGGSRAADWRLEWDGAEPAATAVERLRAAVRRDPAAGWRLSVAAGALQLSPRTLQRELARGGSTFRAEVLGVRLDVAGQLVRRTALPLAQVAAMAGFTDHAHLTHRFTARYGCTPSAFRLAPEPDLTAFG
ncbi:helix-turn-helix transcriptional regulator [Streptomyces sp. NRRL B-24484]|uniref:helix-turn-helix transcriptional regulator n=1 Tax=Streptomyces sp. NRRL B-24484 TaxID=1463833 RepID=UPI0004C0BBCD|nr:helix-turn-helix transcriptional regulator [Streptomyces sp. NRRL B-24484]